MLKQIREVRITKNTSDVDKIIETFNLYEKKMYHIAYSILNDTYLAEDAVMDAFEKLLGGNYIINDAESSETKVLIIKITQSTSIDIYRKNKKKYEKEISADIYGEMSNIPSIGKESENNLELLNGLPENYKEVLKEKYYNDRSTSEIAKKLQIREATVRKRIQRGLELIRKRRSVDNDVY